jgi:hypothetical protein
MTKKFDELWEGTMDELKEETPIVAEGDKDKEEDEDESKEHEDAESVDKEAAEKAGLEVNDDVDDAKSADQKKTQKDVDDDAK